MGLSTSQVDNNKFHDNTEFQEQDFVEMLPGVFVSYSWYNYTESYTDIWTSSYENVSTAISSIEPVDVEPVEPGDETDPGKDILLDPYLIEVDDTDGKSYDIRLEEQWEWSGSRHSTEFIVEIYVDADHSSIDNLSPSESFSDITYDNYTGDELYYSTNFYMFDWSYNYSLQQKYTWVNDQKEVVNPNDIIPNLKEDFKWASIYNESILHEEVGHYSMFGFSVFQQTLLNITAESFPTFDIEHFFQGLSIFNDTNGNCIIDVSYDNYYAFGEDAEIALSSDPTNNYKADNSELVYDVWLTEISLEEVIVPHVVNNQIDWSIKLNNVSAELRSSNGLFSNPTISTNDEADILEVLIPEIVFENHFLINNDVAKLKVDTFIGDFQNSTTGLIPKEFEGLSLAINYWSSIISIIDMSYDLHLTDDKSKEIPIAESLYNSSEWEDKVAFEISSEADNFKFIPVAVEFEDVYTWTKDSKEYEVKTALVPQFTFGGDIYHQAGNTDDYGFTDVVGGGTYYYSSCYIQWDGYGIIHDPEYSSIIPGWTGIITLVFPIAQLAGILIVMVLVIGNFGAILIRFRKA